MEDIPNGWPDPTVSYDAREDLEKSVWQKQLKRARPATTEKKNSRLGVLFNGFWMTLKGPTRYPQCRQGSINSPSQLLGHVRKPMTTEINGL
jgi:hypothetical protein